MKAKQYVGIALIVFGVITLINLYDTIQMLGEYTSLNANQILTWIGIAFTEFVVGGILLGSGESLKSEEGERMHA